MFSCHVLFFCENYGFFNHLNMQSFKYGRVDYYCM